MAVTGIIAALRAAQGGIIAPTFRDQGNIFRDQGNIFRGTRIVNRNLISGSLIYDNACLQNEIIVDIPMSNSVSVTGSSSGPKEIQTYFKHITKKLNILTFL